MVRIDRTSQETDNPRRGQNEPLKLTIMEDELSPEEAAKRQAQRKRFEMNSDWLQAHWSDLLPAARGKHVVVAGQEAYLADSVEEGMAWAKTAHPEDDAPLFRYVRVDPRPQFHTHFKLRIDADPR